MHPYAATINFVVGDRVSPIPKDFAMAHSDLSFKISEKVQVHIDLARKKAVILCETADGKSLHLEAAYPTINKIHDEIRRQLEEY